MSHHLFYRNRKWITIDGHDFKRDNLTSTAVYRLYALEEAEITTRITSFTLSTLDTLNALIALDTLISLITLSTLVALVALVTLVALVALILAGRNPCIATVNRDFPSVIGYIDTNLRCLLVGSGRITLLTLLTILTVGRLSTDGKARAVGIENHNAVEGPVEPAICSYGDTKHRQTVFAFFTLVASCALVAGCALVALFALIAGFALVASFTLVALLAFITLLALVALGTVLTIPQHDWIFSIVKGDDKCILLLLQVSNIAIRLNDRDDTFECFQLVGEVQTGLLQHLYTSS